MEKYEVGSADSVAVDSTEIAGSNISVGQADAKSGMVALALNRNTVLKSKRMYWVGRRTQDIFFTLLALAFLWPFMLIIALIIVIDSPGAGPIFTQQRVGRDGKIFKFYKFRSMIPNAEQKLDEVLKYNEMDGPVFKMKDDVRITRVGKFIRKYGIDELPQLFNIVKGDMSIVGPRPALPREVEQYNDYERQRLFVTPGLTCYWQIQPRRNDLSFQEWMRLDLKYIQERNDVSNLKSLETCLLAKVCIYFLTSNIF